MVKEVTPFLTDKKHSTVYYKTLLTLIVEENIYTRTNVHKVCLYRDKSNGSYQMASIKYWDIGTRKEYGK